MSVPGGFLQLLCHNLSILLFVSITSAEFKESLSFMSQESKLERKLRNWNRNRRKAQLHCSAGCSHWHELLRLRLFLALLPWKKHNQTQLESWCPPSRCGHRGSVLRGAVQLAVWSESNTQPWSPECISRHRAPRWHSAYVQLIFMLLLDFIYSWWKAVPSFVAVEKWNSSVFNRWVNWWQYEALGHVIYI